MMINVIIANCETILRESMKYKLNDNAKINVVGSTDQSDEILSMCEQSQVDVLLLDDLLSRCNELNIIKTIKKKFKKLKIIVLSAINNDEKFLTSIINNVDGFVLKKIMPDDLINVIESVYKNLKIIDNETYKIISKYNNYDIDVNSIELEKKLNEKELTIIKYIIDGKSTKEMSKELFLSEGRIRNIIVDILFKLQLKNRVQLAIFAIKNRIA